MLGPGSLEPNSGPPAAPVRAGPSADVALYLCLIYLHSSFPAPFYLLDFLCPSLAKSIRLGIRLSGFEVHFRAVSLGTRPIASLYISSQTYKMGIRFMK